MSNNSSNAQCRLCNSEKLQLFLSLSNVPQNISCLLRESDFEQDYSISLNIHKCCECDFVQIVDEYLAPTYYDDYLMTVSHSKQMQIYQQFQASSFIKEFNLYNKKVIEVASFIKEFNLYNKKVIEVGCGDGNYLCHLIHFGSNAYGIEPSSKFRHVALQKGLNVFAGYVSTKLLIPEAPYDGFVTRQVLEHVTDIHEFLQGIRLSLNQEAVGLIEVPSLEKAIEDKRFYDFFSDHVNYFSARTLSYALEGNGFVVLDIQRTMNNEYLQAYVKIDTVVNSFDLQKSVNTLTRNINELLVKFNNEKKKVAIWGAGAKGLTTLAIARVSNVEYVIDSDVYKQGFFTPVSHLPIVCPEKLIQFPVDVVIIMAVSYFDEIVRQLREDFHFKGEILSLMNNLDI